MVGKSVLGLFMLGAAATATPAAAQTCEQLLNAYIRAKASRAPLLHANATNDEVARRDRLTKTMVQARKLAIEHHCDTTHWPAL